MGVVYLKVQKDICPKCNKEREIVMKGTCSRKGQEFPDGPIGHKCSNCGDYQKANFKNN